MITLCYRSALSVLKRATLVRPCCYQPLELGRCYATRVISVVGSMCADRIIWVDLEMTGLDVEVDTILEMACIVTDSNLNIIAEGPEVKIHQPDSVLNGMGAWCTEHHGKSGLTAACRSSTTSLTQAEETMLTFVQDHTHKGACPLAGNTVHMDKRFLDKYMPRFSGHLHYRIIDVSSVKELCKRWYPSEHRLSPLKRGTHRALEDIKESIEELKYYKSTVFK